MHTVNPTPDQLDEILQWRFHHPCPGVQHHMEIVALAALSPMACKDVARCAGVCPKTVTTTIKRFNAEGVDGLRVWDNLGSQSEMKPFHRLLRESWREKPPASLAAAAKQLEDATGIRRSPRAVADLLRKHVKKSCLTNVFHADFMAFRAAIDGCLDCAFTEDRESMKTLLALKFQIMPESKNRAS